MIRMGTTDADKEQVQYSTRLDLGTNKISMQIRGLDRRFDDKSADQRIVRRIMMEFGINF